jgi:hypothetical protein
MPQPFCIAEKDASEKWCPFTRNHLIENMYVQSNRLGGRDFSGCLGNGCMAWRYVSTHIGGPGEDLVESGDTHGYCGADGAPAQ